MLIGKWRSQPRQPVVIHSDKASQFGSDAFNRWFKENKPITSAQRYKPSFGISCKFVMILLVSKFIYIKVTLFGWFSVTVNCADTKISSQMYIK